MSFINKFMVAFNKNKALFLIIATAIISGLANFFNKFGMQAVGKNSFQYTTLKNIIVALILSLIILSPKVLSKLKKLDGRNWFMLILIGLIGGSVPFLMYFQGLSLTSAASASFIHKSMFIWVVILAWPILKERVSWLQVAALGILFFGNIIFDGFKNFTWGTAQNLILTATIIWSIESIIAKITLRQVDAMVLAWGRMFFGSIFLLLFLVFSHNTNSLFNLNGTQMSWLVLVSLFLSGYVLTWYMALKMLPANVTASFLVLASPLTAMMNSVFVSHSFASVNLWGVVTILFGIIVFWQIKPQKKYGIKLAKI